MPSKQDKPLSRAEAAAKEKAERTALNLLAEREGLRDPIVVASERDVDKGGAALFRVTAVAKDDPNGAHASIVVDGDGKPVEAVRLAALDVFAGPVFEPPGGFTIEPLKPITIDPPFNELTLHDCETFDETITVTVPKQPAAKADVYFLADTTGSMTSILNAVKAGANAILNAPAWAGRDIAFGVGNYKDFPTDPYAFQHQLAPTPNTALVAAAINTWTAGGGSDTAEGQLFALHRLATDPAIGWRPNAERILVWFGDAPGHDPVCPAISGIGVNLTLASVQAALAGANITVLAISTDTGTPGALDADPTGLSGDYTGTCPVNGGPNQATTLAGATGGQHVSGINPATIVATIVSLVDSAVSTINNLSLVATGGTAPFVCSITPAGGYGPLKGDQEHVLHFQVRFCGALPCGDEDQTFFGALEVVADGVTRAAKRVVIHVPACRYHYSVKFLCGVQKPEECGDEPVRPGIYSTEINILNPSACPVLVEKQVIPLVLAGKAIGREPEWSPPRAKDRVLLPPNAATMDDCRRLSELLFGRPECPLQLTVGFLVIRSERPLDVTAVYTASDLEGRLVTLDVETLDARRP